MRLARISVLTAVLPLAFCASWAQAQTAPAGSKPLIPQVCTTCHKLEPGELRGIFENVAFKTKSLQVKIDNITEIVRFDDSLKVIDVERTGKADLLSSVAKNREILVTFAERDGVKVATQVAFKGPIKIDAAKLVDYDTVHQLVSGALPDVRYTLIDSRPLPRFQEGTIPTAISLPYPAFDKFIGRLPQDKRALVIFFCQGETCMMSPNSMRRAEKMGYTNAKVYREGMPEWALRNVGVMSVGSLQEAWVSKAIPHVLVDARPAAQVQAGVIPGAVPVSLEQVKAVFERFPGKDKKPPIMVYDNADGARALAVAKVIRLYGLTNVNVIEGGMSAWRAAGYAVATGQPQTRIAYVPKLRPGQIAIDEFRKLTESTPPDVLILDVRNQDEANAGMFKGAKLIPDEELANRFGEVPRDKRIITHCATGVRAEMAYHKLKERGYNVAFVKAGVEFKSGKARITDN